MAPYTRTVQTRVVDDPGGASRSIATVDDHFHGFEVVLELRDGEVVSASAASHRHPWSTCPGALRSVPTLRGAPDTVARSLLERGREHTCVHVNDLVWLASRLHRQRRYDIEVTPSGASLARDGVPVFDWRLDGWTIVSTGPFEGMFVLGPELRERLATLGADDDLREALRVMRRAVAVAMGYFELDWASFETAADIDWSVMAGSCHTFTEARLNSAQRLARLPDTVLPGTPEAGSVVPPAGI
jgi:hypothetical protein